MELPVPSETPNRGQDDLYNRKRFSLYIDDTSPDTIAVFLRVKPSADREDDYLTIVEDNTVVMRKSKKTFTYKFTHVFGPNTNQEAIFKKCVYEKLQEFVNRNNVFMLTYGPSGSGKTYSIQGKRGQAGIVPRALAVLFKSLAGRLVTDTDLAPHATSDLIHQNEDQKKATQLIKSEVLERAISEERVYALKHRESIFAEEVERLCNEESLKIEPLSEIVYTVWVSFAEVYNERIYDLLSEDVRGRGGSLDLGTDPEGQCFIKGLRYIQVSSLKEAYQIYLYGRRKLQVFSTCLNDASSRSHSIYTIKLAAHDEDDHISYYFLRSFSFCDLAGVERQKKTGNEGNRLKETQNINSSLTVLNRCFKTIRENQNSNKNKIVPYRESKLTRLLGPAMISGGSHITMLVNVSESPSLSEEAHVALQTSAVASTIVTFRVPVSKRPKAKREKRFSTVLSRFTPDTRIDWGACVSSDTDGPSSVAGPSTLGANQDNLEDLKKQLSEKEEEFMDARVEVLRLKKRLREKSEEIEELNKIVKVSEKLKKMLDNARTEVMDLEEENKELEEENKELEERNKALEDIINEENKELEERNKALEDIINEKDEEINSLITQLENLKMELSLRCPKQLRSRSAPRGRVPFSSDSEDDFDPSFLAPITKAITTGKKKRPPKKAFNPDIPVIHIEGAPGPSGGDAAGNAEKKAKKKLFRQNSDDIGEPSDDTFLLGESQASPSTILQRTLRTGKKY